MHSAALGHWPDAEGDPQATFLHDGRARNLEETILWHGGEAETSRVAYQALPQPQRQALLLWLRQL